MSIGQVLAQLRTDYPDVTISKLRFLEAEGLIEPERTASGYRKFSPADLERLRYILSAQRDHYLPLKVIREHLDAVERGLQPPSTAGGTPRVPDSAHPVDGQAQGDSADQAAQAELRLSADELLANSGLTRKQLDELMSFGVLRLRPDGEYFDADALVVAATVARLAEYGLEPRHVRSFKSAADRQVGLIEQMARPLTRANDEASQSRAADMVTELATLSVRLHTALVRSGLRGGS